MTRGLQLLVDLLLIAAGYAAALAFDPAWSSGFADWPERLATAAALVATAWLAVQWQGQYSAAASPWTDVIQQYSLALGLNLLTQAVCAYLLVPVAPLGLVIAGAALGIALLTAWRRWAAPRLASRQTLLLAGYDGIVAKLLPQLQGSVLGVVGAGDLPLPEGLPDLGTLDRLEDVVREKRPRRIVLALERWPEAIPARRLFELRSLGAVIEDAAALHERLLYRVCGERLSPADFVSQNSLAANRQILAVQAIYTNLAGLALLVLLSPLFVLTAAALLLGGSRKVFETTLCLGFQEIPFKRLAFATRRADRRGHTGVGNWVLRLRLAGLPQLINIVRGEMAFCGPPPVPVAYAQRLSELIPFYAHRFCVKPGMFGWSQIRFHGAWNTTCTTSSRPRRRSIWR
jgi:lipopolysaccharide/colanic/teichoic acid biosynthesis glycosyltransferase